MPLPNIQEQAPSFTGTAVFPDKEIKYGVLEVYSINLLTNFFKLLKIIADLSR